MSNTKVVVVATIVEVAAVVLGALLGSVAVLAVAVMLVGGV